MLDTETKIVTAWACSQIRQGAIHSMRTFLWTVISVIRPFLQWTLVDCDPEASGQSLSRLDRSESPTPSHMDPPRIRTCMIPNRYLVQDAP